MGVITYNGIPSTDVNIEVEHQPNYRFATRDFELVHVPGRNGDFLIDLGGYKNVQMAYDIAFISDDRDFFIDAHKVSRWLHSASGYARLEDTYDPLFYRMASYYESSNMKDLLGQAGRVTINFDCKPQRFLKEGDNPITISSGDTITNPLDQPSRPIITVYGTGDGELMVGSCHITLSDISEYLTIDSEVEDSYKAGSTVSGQVVLEQGYPILPVGDTGITFSGGIDHIEVVPKWWTL